MLDDLSASAANLPDYHILSAELDLSLHRLAEAETEFEAACRLEPTNRLFQLNLAVIRLASTNNPAADDSRAVLRQFSSDAKLGPVALRSLIADRLMNDDAHGALDYSTQLLANAQATLNDRLQQTRHPQAAEKSRSDPRLKGLQEAAATNATMVAQIASWMEVNGFRAEASEWLKTLPGTIQTQTPVRLALVDCYLATTNWIELRNFTAGGDWGQVDYLRLAFSSYAWSKLGESLMADGNWRSAVNAAGDRLGALNALSELAGRWNMSSKQEDLLWRILKRFPDATWARLELEQRYPVSLQSRYFASGNTKGLYRFYCDILSRAPQNLEIKNNAAAIALLLKTNLAKAFQWATEAYARSPTNADVVSTYAYALHLQGRNQEGLAAMQRLTPSQLEQHSVALYYGILLSATGKAKEATPYFQVVRTNGHLLPEEMKLLQETDKSK